MGRCRRSFAAASCARVLDLGCGFGRWAVDLATLEGTSVVGVDYAEEGVRAAEAWARRRNADARFVAARSTELPFPPATFDGVLAALILDNLSRDDLARTMTAVGRATRARARGFFVFNPLVTESGDPAAEDNPTRGCMHVAYRDDELPSLLAGWTVTGRQASDEGFRILEAAFEGPGR
jgi:ubiquinone/menaquinone biosynthesis C-methylase UbiE